MIGHGVQKSTGLFCGSAPRIKRSAASAHHIQGSVVPAEGLATRRSRREGRAVVARLWQKDPRPVVTSPSRWERYLLRASEHGTPDLLVGAGHRHSKVSERVVHFLTWFITSALGRLSAHLSRHLSNFLTPNSPLQEANPQAQPLGGGVRDRILPTRRNLSLSRYPARRESTWVCAGKIRARASIVLNPWAPSTG